MSQLTTVPVARESYQSEHDVEMPVHKACEEGATGRTTILHAKLTTEWP